MSSSRTRPNALPKAPGFSLRCSANYLLFTPLSYLGRLSTPLPCESYCACKPPHLPSKVVNGFSPPRRLDLRVDVRPWTPGSVERSLLLHCRWEKPEGPLGLNGSNASLRLGSLHLNHLGLRKPGPENRVERSAPGRALQGFPPRGAKEHPTKRAGKEGWAQLDGAFPGPPHALTRDPVGSFPTECPQPHQHPQVWPTAALMVKKLTCIPPQTKRASKAILQRAGKPAQGLGLRERLPVITVLRLCGEQSLPFMHKYVQVKNEGCLGPIKRARGNETKLTERVTAEAAREI